MPSFRKLSAAETAVLEQPPIGARAELAREYDAYLAEFASAIMVAPNCTRASAARSSVGACTLRLIGAVWRCASVPAAAR
jgi:hypothetical protein